MSLKQKIKDKFLKFIIELFGVSGANIPPKPQPQTPPDAPAPQTPTADAIPYNAIHWQGGNHAHIGKDAVITKQLRSAVIRGNQVLIDYDQTSDWGLKEHQEKDKDGNIKTWHSYARLCAFSGHIDGAYRGAHFDWLSVGSDGKAQKAKVLSNIYNGYLFGSQTPPKDGRLWFVIVSNDGKFRTTVTEGKRG